MSDRNHLAGAGSSFIPTVLAMLIAAALSAAPVSAQSTYSYSGNTYDTVQGTYTTSMNITGSFTVATQLTPNMLPGTDISAQVTSYSFNDGVQTLTGANSYIVVFTVGTDSFCDITEFSITVWQGESSVSGVTVNYTTGPPDHSDDLGFQGVPCATTADGRCIEQGLSVQTGTDWGILNPAPGTPGTWSGPSCPFSPPVQYDYTGNTYDTVQGAYTTSMNITGGFSISTQLTPNLPAGTDISGQVVSYSFNDGVQTLTQDNSYIVGFTVGTDSFCEITEFSITVWQGESSVSGVDVSYATGPPDQSRDYGYQGVPCFTTGGGRCIQESLDVTLGTDYGILQPIPGTPGTWSGPSCPFTPPSQYDYTGNPYDTVQGAYTTSMNITGGFTVPLPLPPDLPPGTDITDQVLSYSYNDGVQTLTEDNSYIVVFTVGTDSFCDITEFSITVWQGDSSVSGVTVNYSTGPPDHSDDFGFQGVPCATTDGGRCIEQGLAVQTGTDWGILSPLPGTPGTWSGPGCRQQQEAESIPTLDRWGLTLFAVLMASVAMWILARRRLV